MSRDIDDLRSTERCDTCGSDDPKVRNRTISHPDGQCSCYENSPPELGRCATPFLCEIDDSGRCPDPFHDTPEERKDPADECFDLMAEGYREAAATLPAEVEKALHGVLCYDDPEQHPEAACLTDYHATLRSHIQRLQAQSCVEFDDVLRSNEELIAERDSLTEEVERLREVEKAWRFLAGHSVECHWERNADDPRGQVVFPVERLPDVTEAILNASLEAVKEDK